MRNVRTTFIRWSITIGAASLVAADLLWQDLGIDSVTLGLLLLAVLPWLGFLLQRVELPGGWKVDFREVRAAEREITREAAPPEKPPPRPSYVEIADRDPNLALVGLRIEIERRLQSLAVQHGIDTGGSVMNLFEELRDQGVLDASAVRGFRRLVTAGNEAAHGATVEPAAAAWALEVGPRILAVLDDKLEGGAGERPPSDDLPA
jgi:hypothetical protein